jgi:hypothetical protein
MKKIIVWGTGNSTANIFNEYLQVEDIDCFVETIPTKNKVWGKQVFAADNLPELKFDLLLVASNFSYEIYNKCIELKLDQNKIFFVYHNYFPLAYMNLNEDYVTNILGKPWMDKMSNQFEVIVRNRYFNHLGKRNDFVEKSWIKKRDFVRVETLELLVNEIQKNKIEGNLAELGVFRGEFASLINALLGDRFLYLLDTFESFDIEEFRREYEKKNCSEEFFDTYKDTSVESVLQRMSNKKNIKIIKGLFPQSIKQNCEIEDKEFALVSLDVDFEASMYEGLSFFYPRLVVGGYIMIHDYNSECRGISSALERYEKDNGISLAKFPVCDEFGTIVITK